LEELMRRIGRLVVVMVAMAAPVFAEEKSLEQLPKDVWELAFVWTEPIKAVARETRRFDPVSGLWFGLVEGTVKSFERATEFFLSPLEESDVSPEQGRSSGRGKALWRYTF
jgi:hypothetical protein